jgi:hypothetical protein
MKDYWNDPPEEPEPPSCPFSGCEGSGEFDRDTPTHYVFICDECGRDWTIDHPDDPAPLEDVDYDPDYEPEGPELCPHGNAWGDCSACDHLGDIAYDTYRENRLR